METQIDLLLKICGNASDASGAFLCLLFKNLFFLRIFEKVKKNLPPPWMDSCTRAWQPDRRIAMFMGAQCHTEQPSTRETRAWRKLPKRLVVTRVEYSWFFRGGGTVPYFRAQEVVTWSVSKAFHGIQIVYFLKE